MKSLINLCRMSVLLLNRHRTVSIILLCVSISLYLINRKINVNFSDMSDIKQCPACYGRSLCVALPHLTPLGFSVFNRLNKKNAFAVTSSSGRLLYVKKMAPDHELKMVDSQLCEGQLKSCRLPGACTKPNTEVLKRCNIKRTAQDFAKRLGRGPLLSSDLYGIKEFPCPTQRLADRIGDKFLERNTGFAPEEEKVTILYSLIINPESIILQTFPSGEGWPFPIYLGSCGRLIIEEHIGTPLVQFFNAPWPKRAKLARKILHIADMFTDNAAGFKLYWTNVAFDNVAVNSKGDIVIVDADNIYVTDAHEIWHDQPKGYDILHEHKHPESCSSKTSCLEFDPTKWCSSADSDFNYYAVCLQLLSSHSRDESGYNGGLLHDIPDIKEKQKILSLLEECVKPTQKHGRLKAKNELQNILNKFE